MILFLRQLIVCVGPLEIYFVVSFSALWEKEWNASFLFFLKFYPSFAISNLKSHILHCSYFLLVYLPASLLGHIYNYLNGSLQQTGFQGNDWTSTPEPTSSASLGMFYATLKLEVIRQSCFGGLFNLPAWQCPLHASKYIAFWLGNLYVASI